MIDERGRAVCPKCGCPSKDGEEVLRCPRCSYTKEFMRYEEFARLMEVSAISIRRWEKKGIVMTRKFGPGVVRIHGSEYSRIAGLEQGETG